MYPGAALNLAKLILLAPGYVFELGFFLAVLLHLPGSRVAWSGATHVQATVSRFYLRQHARADVLRTIHGTSDLMISAGDRRC